MSARDTNIRLWARLEALIDKPISELRKLADPDSPSGSGKRGLTRGQLVTDIMLSYESADLVEVVGCVDDEWFAEWREVLNP